jgi:hypothetical protein
MPKQYPPHKGANEKRNWMMQSEKPKPGSFYFIINDTQKVARKNARKGYVKGEETKDSVSTFTVHICSILRQKEEACTILNQAGSHFSG